jgi:uncharacterized protein YndB with AHSA1/START domain
MQKPPDSLVHRLDRRVTLPVPPATVFNYFTDSTRWARWFGAGSTIEARPGGAMRIVFPGGAQITGEVVEATAPGSIVFTYGNASGTPIPPSGSRVTVGLKDHEGGTKLRLSHAFTSEGTRNEYVQGWRYQLSVLANLVTTEAYADAAATVDGWFEAFSDANDATRNATLDRVVAPDIEFRDRFSLVLGLDDLRPHLAAGHKFMPGMRLARVGDVRHCQGTVLADWVATGPDGAERGRGTNVFTLSGDGRVSTVVGFWD